MRYFERVINLLTSINTKQDEILTILKNHRKENNEMLFKPRHIAQLPSVVESKEQQSLNCRNYYSTMLHSFGIPCIKDIDVNGNVTVRFGDFVFEEGKYNTPRIGMGLTYEDACKDYCKQIAGKTFSSLQHQESVVIPKDIYQPEYDIDKPDKYAKILESTGFKINADFRKLDNKLMVSFESAEISDGVTLSGEYGIGYTYDEACKDYCKRIAGKTLVFHAMSKERFSYKVPEIFYKK